MRRAAITAPVMLLLVGIGASLLPAQDRGAFLQTFDVEKSDLGPTGRNPYFILEPGYTLVLTGSEDGRKASLVIRVLNETVMIGGVETRVVEERESLADTLVEVSRNYYAVSRNAHDVYCFGEDVDHYRHGELSGHSGSWRAEGDNRFGLAMPATPRLGQRYCQEIAPGVALDRAEVVALSDSLSTPAGRFTKVLRIEETSPMEPGVKEYKCWAPGVGLIKDGDLLLAEEPGANRPGRR